GTRDRRRDSPSRRGPPRRAVRPPDDRRHPAGTRGPGRPGRAPGDGGRTVRLGAPPRAGRRGAGTGHRRARPRRAPIDRPVTVGRMSGPGQGAARCLVPYPVPVTWMRKRDHGVLTNAASLLICGLLAGIVVAAAAFPIVAMTGLAAKASSDAFDNLPTQLLELPPPQISYVYANDGKTLLAMLYDENRRDVHLQEVAPVMVQAIVAAEDSRFYIHHGVDMKGVARAVVANRNSDGQVSQGASTLTMQYVRQALAYSARSNEEIVAATEQTPARKLREMKFALAIEKKYNK